ncbi:MAG: hypothetical protein HYV16_11545 [Gammaproteobacteria bacterium]|nr:hypothetical protein [Gammaproteobacteria bacterium]
MTASAPENSAGPAPRLDKWLWAARFFKTRALAREAVEGGKVHVAGQRAKPSRLVNLGMLLTIQTPGGLYTVAVRGLSELRGPAPVAQALYEETADSRTRREAEREAKTLQADLPSRRPDKKQRRQIHQFWDENQ